LPRKPSPRPTYDGPTAIPFRDVPRHVWGDEESGYVTDWIYVSSENIHQIIFGLPAGGAFRHSSNFRTYFNADVAYRVLSGELVLTNPEKGEVRHARTGEWVHFRGDTWHHGFSQGTEPLRVVEFLSPPPRRGTTQSYGTQHDNLENPVYVDDRWLGRWPAARSENLADASIHVLNEKDALWRLDGNLQQTRTGILVSTEHLTSGVIHLPPGASTDLHTHAGDESLCVAAGTLSIHLPESSPTMFELGLWDGAYIPEGTPHRYYNSTATPVEICFGVAPNYLQAGS